MFDEFAFWAIRKRLDLEDDDNDDNDSDVSDGEGMRPIKHQARPYCSFKYRTGEKVNQDE
jgi:hypothetical protein